jgi:hypothetical protein
MSQPKLAIRDVEKLIRLLDRSQRNLFNVVVDHLVVHLMFLEIVEREVFGEDPDLRERMARAAEVVAGWRKQDEG